MNGLEWAAAECEKCPTICYLPPLTAQGSEEWNFYFHPGVPSFIHRLLILTTTYIERQSMSSSTSSSFFRVNQFVLKAWRQLNSQWNKRGKDNQSIQICQQSSHEFVHGRTISAWNVIILSFYSPSFPFTGAFVLWGGDVMSDSTSHTFNPSAYVKGRAVNKSCVQEHERPPPTLCLSPSPTTYVGNYIRLRRSLLQYGVKLQLVLSSSSPVGAKLTNAPTMRGADELLCISTEILLSPPVAGKRTTCTALPSSLGINIGENKDRIRSLVNVSRLRSLKEVEAASSVKAATAKPAESSTNQTDGGSSEGVLIPAKGVSRHTKSEQFSIVGSEAPLASAVVTIFDVAHYEGSGGDVEVTLKYSHRPGT
ncbi:hypothetical protein EGR_07982 [Echinococcus granulosus]|uniref:Uncharacterized protein n=1 Tax=Echinococcus granulosus TaxID=6210 RepID=W6U7L5_ECHGR|nr:hypothetical protein EGR_07982 [Echinococcus granulosus]EUB57165.1 hypothetical protein EGR_07982 [Echinococcus granulosus]